MVKKLRILIIEDSPDDRDLLLMHLRSKGISPDYQCIETKKELEKALKEKSWDIIISDYSMPKFDGLTALRIIKETGFDFPFILISGEIGEELAVQAMKDGASDYLMKGSLHRLVPAIEREIKEAKNREKQRVAEEQSQRLLNILQKSLNEIYTFNSGSLNFDYANESALQNLGYTIDELTQLTPIDLKKEYTKETYTQKLEPLLKNSKEKIVLNTFHKRKDGSEYPVEVHIQAIKENNQTFFTAISLDLTSHKRSENLIRKQKELAQQLALNSKYKSEFLAIMSHELRTPLNSILLLSKLLSKKQENGLNERQAEYVNEIHYSSNTLMNLINDVLDISKIEAGEMSFSIKTVKVEHICNNIYNSFSLLAKEKNLNFELHNRVDPAFSVNTDSLRVEQVIKNFLSNAFKFTDSGSVKFKIYIPSKEEGEKHLPAEKHIIAFSVEDTGIGINEKEQNKIFEPFRQVDSSAERRFSGTGLGLSISREIATGLGGTVSLESKPEKGSTFTVYLPADSSKYVNDGDLGQKLTPISVPETSFPQPFKNSFTILLVDDSELHVTALKELIEDEYKACLITNSANETYKILSKTKVDLIVLDLGLPDADGFEVIKNIRSDYSFSELPIIVYSGRHLTDKEKLSFSSDVNKFVTKTSGSFQDLMKAIDYFLKIERSINHDFEPIDEQGHFNLLKNKKILIVDDDERNIYSLSQILQQYQLNIFTSNNGEEALHFLKENNQVDLILMDIMMPKMNGIDAILKIRENSTWKNLPIIAVTAKSTPEDRLECLNSGASDYISKPVDIERLILMIYKWLKLPPQLNLF